MLRDVGVVDDLDALRGELLADLDVHRRVLGDELEDAAAGRGELLGRRPAVRRVGEAPASTCWRRPATRIWKNSSRMPAKIVRNFTRSRSGLRASRASYRTRALKSSHDSSRLRYGALVSRRGRTARAAGRRGRAAVVGSDGGRSIRQARGDPAVIGGVTALAAPPGRAPGRRG